MLMVPAITPPPLVGVARTSCSVGAVGPMITILPRIIAAGTLPS